MTEAADQPKRKNCVLIAGGVWHDIDFARFEILRHLGQDPSIRTRVFEDYRRIDALDDADFLVSYTCNVVPSAEEQEALRAWVEGGGRWYALHGTNCILEAMDDGLWHAPRVAPVLMDVLGTQFLSHPPIAPYTVRVADPAHPLVQDIEPFETTDELYHVEQHGDLHVLLDTECTVEGRNFAEGDEAPGVHPVMYIKARGQGGVLYNTLGHCRGHYDMQPMLDWWPSVDRCAWNLPVFHELLQRGIAWAAEAPKA